MKKTFLLFMLFWSVNDCLFAQSNFPEPEVNGDYLSSESRTWQNWLVVDDSTEGLNCRLSDEFREAWLGHYLYEGTPRMDIYQWSVVTTFQKNTTLVANLTPAGNNIILDERGRPWLKIQMIPNTEETCLVRANSIYIKPVEKQLKSGESK